MAEACQTTPATSGVAEIPSAPQAAGLAQDANVGAWGPYRSLTGLAKAIPVMIWSTAIGMAVLMGVGWGTAAYSNLLLARSLAIIGWLTFLISAATGVLYLVWLYRAVANLRYLGADSSDFLPGATIFCHFFPLLNLIVPFQVLLDLSKASQSPKHWREQKKSRVVIVWWIATAAFFFNGLFIVSVAMVGLPAHSAMLVTISAWATLASFVIPPLCLMHVVKKVTQQQETLHAVYS